MEYTAMTLDMNLVGREFGPAIYSWTSRDTMLYALGVGAGQDDALQELAFTTENTEGTPQKVLPSYAVLLMQNTARAQLGNIDHTRLVHAGQAFTLARPLSPEGSVVVRNQVSGIYDKGSGALVVTQATARDAVTDEVVATSTSSVFIMGEGGFGGDRGPSEKHPVPERAPDIERRFQTRQDQALLYRLSGDRNPLHSDPAFAARGGFARPILHGMCTYGITARILLHAFCDSDPSRVHGMQARFTKPVLPGDALQIQGWREGDVIRFRTLGADGIPVLDGGHLHLA